MKSLHDTVIGLSFSSRIKISEHCNPEKNNVNLIEGTILIYENGNKEHLYKISHPFIRKDGTA